MTIFVDSLMDHGWFLRGKPTKNCHMWSDKSPEDLTEFGLKIGMHPEWLQKSRTGLIHLDLNSAKRKLAIKNGAIENERSEKMGRSNRSC